MLIGYARVSTQDQTLDLQLDALKKAGCEKLYTDTASGAKAEREGLDEAVNYAREGDVLVVWRLDRLGRSLRHLIDTITILSNRKVGFRSITENIDTTTSGGKLVFHIFGALAQRLVMTGQDSAREVVEAGAARRAAVALPVRLGVVPAVPGDRGAAAGRAAHALGPAVLAHQLEALRVVDQGRQVHQGRRGHGRHRGSREHPSSTAQRLAPHPSPDHPGSR